MPDMGRAPVSCVGTMTHSGWAKGSSFGKFDDMTMHKTTRSNPTLIRLSHHKLLLRLGLWLQSRSQSDRVSASFPDTSPPNQ